MGDSHSWKPGTRPGSSPSLKPTAAPAKPGSAQPDSAKPTTSARPAPALSQPAPATRPGDSPERAAGRIVHDARGNAVWDWLKDTARTAVDSTSRLLRKLEVPELKLEDTQSQELRGEPDRDYGGGYDPYGSSNPTPSRAGSARGSGSDAANNSGGGYDPYGGSNATPGRASGARGSGGTPSTGNARGGGPTSNVGGGYDPYGKGVTNKPTRKP